MIRSLDEATAIFVELDEKYGTRASKIPIVYNPALKTSLARTHFAGRNPTMFDFSKISLNLDYDSFKQVVLHEYAHYLAITKDGVTGHNVVFRNYCNELGCWNNQASFKDVQAIESTMQIMKENEQ